MEKALVVGTLVVLALFVVYCCSCTARRQPFLGSGAGSYALREELRRLWFDHVERTHHFIISTLGGLPDAGEVAAHLHENQDPLAAAVGRGPAGPGVTRPLAVLLHEHIDIAGRLVAALKDKQPAAAQLGAAWYQNADQIAALLSKANPRWAFPAARAMMRAHLDATTAVVKARLAGDWTRAVRLFDRVADQAQGMADMLAGGTH